MRGLLLGAAGLLLVLAAVQAQGDAKNQPPTQSQQPFQKLQQDYRNETAKITVRQAYAQKFLELVEKNPKEPAALTAFLESRFDGPFTPFGADPLKTKVLNLLVQNHLQSEKLGELVTAWLGRGSLAGPAGRDPAREQLLRTILAKSPHHAVQGQACWALAQYLKTLASEPGRADSVKLAKETNELFDRVARQYADVLVASLPTAGIDPAREQLLRTILAKNPERTVRGQACFALAQYLKNLSESRPTEAEQLNKEVETLLEQVVKEFADLPFLRGRKLAMATGQLNEIRHLLAIGKPAQEIEAEDIDGKTFKLSDYRGKVVLLDFWGHW